MQIENNYKKLNSLQAQVKSVNIAFENWKNIAAKRSARRSEISDLVIFETYECAGCHYVPDSLLS